MTWRTLDRCGCRLCVETRAFRERRERIVDVLFAAICLVVFLAVWCAIEAHR